jgi:MYXO-CTERM domain-containing protein
MGVRIPSSLFLLVFEQSREQWVFLLFHLPASPSCLGRTIHGWILLLRNPLPDLFHMITKLPWFKRPVRRAALLSCIFSAASAFAIPQVATPTFNPAAGVYSTAQSVSIASATSGASIAYTTDGTIPTESSGVVTHGTLYSGAITAGTTTLSAIAFESGYLDSAVAIDGYALRATVAPACSMGVFTPLVVSSPTLNVIYNFTPASSAGINPVAALIQATDGNLYGTTPLGGTSNLGTVFKVTTTGTFTNLVSFNGANGNSPEAALVQGTDGNFYGTTLLGGSNNDGTVFKTTSTGALTALLSFNGTSGGFPYAGLVQGTDGNFYGTTEEGGSSNEGTVFTITTTTTFTSLVPFTGANGSNPFANVIQGNDGDFYGTTHSGGSGGDGSVFKTTAAGSLTTLVSFNSSSLPLAADGGMPLAALVQGGDGNFYGTTSQGGSSSLGTIFKMTPAGTLTTLVTFTGANGAEFSSGINPLPEAALVQGSDGNFYGTTPFGGTNGAGTIFKMTPAGVLTTLFSFNTSNGANPYAGLVQGSDGNFYGTTQNGGSLNDGVVFQLILPPATAAPVFSPAPGTYTGAQNVTITSATSGASIRYTTDGSTPTETTGTLYSGPISISTTTTLSAIAFKSGLADSTVITPTYTIQASSGGISSGSSSSGSVVVSGTGAVSSGGGGAPSWWFLGLLALAGVLRWKLRRTNPLPY